MWENERKKRKIDTPGGSASISTTSSSPVVSLTTLHANVVKECNTLKEEIKQLNEKNKQLKLENQQLKENNKIFIPKLPDNRNNDSLTRLLSRYLNQEGEGEVEVAGGNFNILPSDVIVNIIVFLTPQEIMKFSHGNSYVRGIIRGRGLWQYNLNKVFSRLYYESGLPGSVISNEFRVNIKERNAKVIGLNLSYEDYTK